MKRYDCKDCIHSGKGGVLSRNKKCAKCTVSSGNMSGKPTNFERKVNTQKGGIS